MSNVGPGRRRKGDIVKLKLKISSTTYAGRPTDMISVPLTIRVRCTMAFAVCAWMLWGTPRIKISLEIPKSLISF